MPDGGVLLVRVAIGAEQDDQREGGETFSLLVRRGTILSEGRAEIRDDGTGISYSGDVSNGKAVASTVGLDDDFDRDGIAPTVEEMLATMVASQGTGSIGDINGDGFQDAEQSALATLAWVTEGNFRAANEGTLTEIKPIIAISVTRSSANDGSPPVDVSSQLTNIAVLPYAENSSGGGMPNPSGTMADGSIVDAPWDPIVFGVQAKDSSQQLADSDATRAGTQTRVYIDISRAGVRDGEFNAYYKYVSAEVLEATASNGGLRDLDGKAITQPGWYDFTQRKDAAGAYVGDGARFVVDQGRIIGIELNFTDNAFGDNDPALNRINDPGVPVHVTAPPPKPVIPPPVFDQARLSRPELLAPAVLPVEDFGQQYQPLRFDSALYPLLAETLRQTVTSRSRCLPRCRATWKRQLRPTTTVVHGRLRWFRHRCPSFRFSARWKNKPSLPESRAFLLFRAMPLRIPALMWRCGLVRVWQAGRLCLPGSASIG